MGRADVRGLLVYVFHSRSGGRRRVSVADALEHPRACNSLDGSEQVAVCFQKIIFKVGSKSSQKMLV